LAFLPVSAQAPPRNDQRTSDAATKQHALKAARYDLCDRSEMALTEQATDVIEPKAGLWETQGK
jgi:hypothetical protein